MPLRILDDLQLAGRLTFTRDHALAALGITPARSSMTRSCTTCRPTFLHFRMTSVLEPLDIVVGFEARLWAGAGPWSFERLAASIGIGASQAHTSEDGIAHVFYVWPPSAGIEDVR